MKLHYKIMVKCLMVLMAWFTVSAQPLGTSETRLRYESFSAAQAHLKLKLLYPTLPLNAMRKQVYARYGKGKRDGNAGWEKFSTDAGPVRACIVPTEDGVERVTIVTLLPKDRLSWRDMLKSQEALQTITLLHRDEDGKKTLQIRIGNIDPKHSMQITVIAGEEWIEQITWTLVG